jgi:hypothetical protein
VNGSGFYTDGGSPDPQAGSYQAWPGFVFENSDTGLLYLHSVIPTGWDGQAISLRIQTLVEDYSGVATFYIATRCINDGDNAGSAGNAGPGFSAEQTLSKAVGNGSNYLAQIFSLSNLTANGCTANSEIRLRIRRDNTDAFGGLVLLKGLDLTFLVNLQ